MSCFYDGDHDFACFAGPYVQCLNVGTASLLSLARFIDQSQQLVNKIRQICFQFSHPHFISHINVPVKNLFHGYYEHMP